MARIDSVALDRQRRRNRVVSMVVFAGIVAWSALVGWLVLGVDGVVWAALAGALLLMFQPVRSATLIKAMFGASPLGPSDAPGLYRILRELSQRAELERVPPVLYIPRPEVIALSTGWGRDATVAVSDGLLRHLHTRELVAVLAHEVAHLRAGDLKILRLADAAGRLTRFLALVGLFLVLFSVPAAAMVGASVSAWPILLLLAAPIASDLMTFKLSRTREFDADAGAAGLTGDPHGLVLALERIDRFQSGGWERLTRLPGWRWLSWIRTHPTTAERIARLHQLTPEPESGWIALSEALLPPGFQPPPRFWWPRRM